jgi:hypothetical protein
VCMKLILEEAPFISPALLSRDLFSSRKVLGSNSCPTFVYLAYEYITFAP